MKNILIANINYKTGGIKKSLDNIVNYLSKDNRVDIQFFDCPQLDSLNWTNENVRVLKPIKELDAYFVNRKDIKTKRNRISYLFLKAKFRFKRKRIGSESLIKRIIDEAPINDKHYDVAISFSHDIWVNDFSGGCNYYVLKKVNAKKKYAWIHGEMSNIGLDREKALRTYKGFDKVITVSMACCEQFKHLVGNIVECDYIYNLFNAVEIRKKAEETIEGFEKDSFTIITVGRVHKIKRLDKLNRIAKMLFDNGYNFKWYVVGGGDLLPELVQQSRELGLCDNVFYIGEQSNPYKYIKQADLFVLLSDSESFSIVLNEALILGVPVISTNFPAVYETIVHKKNGIIVEKYENNIFDAIARCINNTDGIYKAMKEELISNPWEKTLEEKSASKLLDLLENGQ